MRGTGPRPRACLRRTFAASKPGSRWPTWWTRRPDTDLREPAEEPAPELATLADLPFHVLGRYPKPLLIAQCKGGTIAGQSTRDWFDRIRDLSLGLASLGVTTG